MHLRNSIWFGNQIWHDKKHGLTIWRWLSISPQLRDSFQFREKDNFLKGGNCRILWNLCGRHHHGETITHLIKGRYIGEFCLCMTGIIRRQKSPLWRADIWEILYIYIMAHQIEWISKKVGNMVEGTKKVICSQMDLSYNFFHWLPPFQRCLTLEAVTDP